MDTSPYRDAYRPSAAAMSRDDPPTRPTRPSLLASPRARASATTTATTTGSQRARLEPSSDAVPTTTSVVTTLAAITDDELVDGAGEEDPTTEVAFPRHAAQHEPAPAPAQRPRRARRARTIVLASLGTLALVATLVLTVMSAARRTPDERAAAPAKEPARVQTAAAPARVEVADAGAPLETASAPVGVVDEAPSARELSDRLVDVARAAFERGDLHAARTTLERAHRAHPTSPHPAVGLAEVHHRLGDRVEACTWIERAIRLRPRRDAYRTMQRSLGCRR